jgi:hypothetical protein
MRLLRAAVRVRHLSRHEGFLALRRRVRPFAPYLGSGLLNLALILVLALGYTSFVAKGRLGAGTGERVVTVQLFENLPDNPLEPELRAEDDEQPQEDAEMGAETLPEGAAIESGEDVGETEGGEAPETELGEQVTAPQVGVAVPQIALPDVDAGEGRPDGVVGVDCYRIFAGERDKALECAGREILSGWRAEVANLGEDWRRFERLLGREGRQIRYGPLRSDRDPIMRGYNPAMAVPPEVQEAYAREVARLRYEQYIREYGRPEDTASRDAVRRSEDAATYDPLQPEHTLGKGPP